MKATLIKKLNDTQNLYRLDVPIEKFKWDVDEKTVSYRNVVSSICSDKCAELQGRYEVYLFGANKAGQIVDWVELPGSQKGTRDIEQPLRDLGYEIVSE